MAELYRKSSIEKLSNPEQLDRAIKLTSPMSWLALMGVVLIIVVTLIWSIVGTLPDTQTVNGIVVSPESVCAYYSDVTGTVTKVLKKDGDKVKRNDEIAIVKLSDGKEHIIKATVSGKITELLVQEETRVYSGAEIARYTPNISAEQVVVCYVPSYIANQLEVDMDVLLYPTSVDTQKYGHMEATIESIGEYAASTNNMWYVVGADNLVAEQFLSSGPVMTVVCKIKTDKDTDSGYYWSSDKGKNVTISDGVFVSAKIITDESAPIMKLFSNIKEKLEG